MKLQKYFRYTKNKAIKNRLHKAFYLTVWVAAQVDTNRGVRLERYPVRTYFCVNNNLKVQVINSQKNMRLSERGVFSPSECDRVVHIGTKKTILSYGH